MTAVVIATRNRCRSLLRTLDRIARTPDVSEVIVVDNASTDGSPEAVERSFPRVRIAALTRNCGAAARTVGVAWARSPIVAFADDDSWWAPGALAKAAEHFREHPWLGLVAARILVEPERRLDPTCERMATSPLPRAPSLPGPSILGFVACGALVRREAYLGVGGFEPRLFLGGEEALLALDLASAGWGLCYAPDVVAHHDPAVVGDREGRRRLVVRNDLWSAWLRLRAGMALSATARAARRGRCTTARRDADCSTRSVA